MVDVGGRGGEERRSLDEDDTGRWDVVGEEMYDLFLDAGCCFRWSCLSVFCLTCVVCQCVYDDCICWFECDGAYLIVDFV